jgi:hypothetical protein
VSAPAEVFRFPSAIRNAPDVDAWLKQQPGELHQIAGFWFARLRRCGEDVHELMHDGCPVACVEEAAFAYLNVFTAHVSVGFFHGATLDDPAQLLEGAGKRMRHVKLKPGAEPDYVALDNLIDDAYQDMKMRILKSVD